MKDSITYFKELSKFVIGHQAVPQKICDKLIVHHMIPMNTVRAELGFPVYPSQESGYRPYIWEIARGRNGNSEHTFGEQEDGTINDSDLGAVDWTCENFAVNKDKLLNSIYKNTNYTRIAIYSTFIHCDYKAIDGYRYIFKSNSKSQWKFEKRIPLNIRVIEG